MSMTRHILHVSDRRVTTVPLQITEVTSTTDCATDVRLAVENWHDDGIMSTCQMYHTYKSGTGCHTHIHVDAISCAFINGNQVVARRKGITHHLGRHQPILTQKLQLVAFHDRSILRLLCIKPTQLIHLTLQIEITKSQVLIHFSQ